ncbi:hypothetical protein CHLRE_06g296924v5 [Chlamydomonas reinhardtii]|uniref:Uncharacterized protein n=1 Tax=Chlamydomonas reinhardtii TaxID=3055 RepID=A0A2K3DQS6_CHLRE|nr:uncharacterized protein CHLRE_06g296924v5 [Chlamydomonas reinhardtii]PNW82847.1 hypothetical protein CHLRE_06g296924v5 [Chlamydomonas reinhardtii]
MAELFIGVVALVHAVPRAGRRLAPSVAGADGGAAGRAGSSLAAGGPSGVVALLEVAARADAELVRALWVGPF